MTGDAFAEAVKAERQVGFLRVLDEPKTVSEAAEDAGVPRQTVYKWIHRFEEVGLVEEAGAELATVGSPATKYARTADEIVINLDGRPDE